MRRAFFLSFIWLTGCSSVTDMHAGDHGGVGLSCAPVITTLAASPSLPLDIQADADRIYWLTEDGELWAVGRSGGQPLLLARAGACDARHNLAMDDDNLYWADAAGAVLSAPKTGGAATQLAEANGAAGVTLEGDDVFVVSLTTGTVGMVSKGGGPATEVATISPRPTRLAANANELFWLADSEDVLAVGRVGKDGSGLETLSARPVGHRYGTAPTLAVDAGSVYWADADLGCIRSVAKRGGTVTSLTCGSMPWGIALDDRDSLFYTDNASTTWSVRRVSRQGGSDAIVAEVDPDKGFWFYPFAVVVSGGEVFWTDQNANSVMKAACR